MGPLAESLVVRDIVPTILEHDPDLDIEPPRDQRDLFLQVLLDHVRALGRAESNICLVEPKYVAEGPNEQSALAAYCQMRHGTTAVHADPRELRLAGGEVYYEDTRIDVAYRDYEVRELLELEAQEGRRLDAMRALFRQNRIVSSVGGEFDHKSSFDVLTDDELASRHFSVEERRLFHRHVLWTRLVTTRVTTLPEGQGDLPEFIRRHREELVLKPNRAYGGTGIQIGALASASGWEAALERALRAQDDPHGSWVVQSLANLPVHDFPVVEDGRVHSEPFYAVMGFTPTENGLSILCRVSQRQVVNVAQRGGLAPVLVGHKPRELRAPLRAAVPREQAERRLHERVRRLRDLDAVIGLLDWDEETYLPDGGRPRRGAQLATVESLRHDLLVDDALGDLIEEVAAHAGDDALKQAELARLRRLRRLALALPHDLVGAFAEARSRTLAAWEQARKSDGFGDFARPFAALLALARERAQALQRTDDLYDGLLDEYEPGMTRARLDPLLRAIGTRLAPLVGALAERTARYAATVPQACYPDTVQAAFCRSLLADMGFEFVRGRIDRSTHPFTIMAGEDDVRVTLRVSERNPLSAILATLHEGGHALYDQGFPVELHGTLLAEAPSMGLHESQARLWENHVGRSDTFWAHYFPKLRDAFPEPLAGLETARFYRAVNVVRPGPIRVEADEVTYGLHVLLRYELETALLSGELAVGELAAAWAERSVKWLGITPASMREGCLQDVHWALGAFGYFPSYVIGNLYAAQLVEAYAASGDLDGDLGRGELRPLRNWLARRVYAFGCREEAERIVERATGRGLDAEAFFRLLAARFEKIG
jgi:carboxypeptidase Taq